MRHLIVWLIHRALALCLPARGHHRPEATPEAPSRHICEWGRPIHPHTLTRTMPPPPYIPRISPALARWESLPEDVQRVELAALAEAAWPQWLKIKAEAEKRHQTPEDEKRRRAELFATAYDLPSPNDLAGAMG
ncbi:hypothetical protein ACGF0D_25785 [Kitasatospora sp. NPDC048298]|uniref:hypothetical protein n=1 Tax=Kitasatospora sp. NPDC048298 TaxID=3364049 RepID=UPI00371D70C7